MLRPLALVAVCAALTVTYVAGLGCSVVECLRFLSGAILLWAPLGVPIYLALGRSVASGASRLALAAVGSYTLTTLAFFLLAVAGLDRTWVFVTLIAGVWAAVLYRTPSRRVLRAPRVDGLLVVVILVSLCVNLPFKTPFAVDESAGTHTYVLHDDHHYHVGQSYALANSIPPAEQMIRSGTPERAYHNFPHVTVMLLARATGQPDMLRAHLAYHYTVMEVLLCLSLYAMGRLLTGSRWGGLLAAALVYVFVPPGWPLVPNGIDVFHFTVFPHRTSALDPVRVASPQMYSGLVVLYGVLLGLAHVVQSRRSAFAPWALSLLMALMCAATLRFRIHIFLVLVPLFLVLMGWMAWRTRRLVYLFAAAATVTVCLVLFLEMRSTSYLPDTTSLRFGHNGLTTPPDSILNAWPSGTAVRAALESTLAPGPLRDWVWQAVSMSAFVVLNIMGLPLIVALAFALLKRDFRDAFGPWLLLVLGLIVASLLGAIVISVPYDLYSVAGQMLFHTRWYAFPLLVPLLFALVGVARRRLPWSTTTWSAIFCTAVLAAGGAQVIAPEGVFFEHIRKEHGSTLSADAWKAFEYLRDETPPDAQIVSNHFLDFFYWGGLGARATFVACPGNPVDRHARALGIGDDRARAIADAWALSDGERLAATLATWPVSHVVEFKSEPLAADLTGVLDLAWVAPEGTIRIWRLAAPARQE